MSIRRILEFLAEKGACLAGKAVYLAAKGTARVLNVTRRRRQLHRHTRDLMQPCFPDLDLDRVRVVPEAILPSSWFSAKVDAITFGYTIYLKAGSVRHTAKGKELLLHELVHVDQVRRRGDDELAFACDYARGFLDAGGYRRNPLEVEACDFVARRPLP